MNRRRTPFLMLVVTLALTACASSGKTNAGTPTTKGGTGTAVPTSAARVDYHSIVKPADFTAQVTNQYFPLKPGTTKVLDGTRDGAPQHTEMHTTTETKVIMGVTCIVVRDDVTSNGALVEKTTDWYAQHKNGDVWYFGEDTKEYTNGVVSSTHGTWEAGVDNAQPGIVMKADPKVGDSYRQEYRPGEAEDMAKVLSIVPSQQIAGNTYPNVVVTEDTDPLNPDKIDEKRYTPGIGIVYTKRIRTGHQEESTYVKTTTA